MELASMGAGLEPLVCIMVAHASQMMVTRCLARHDQTHTTVLSLYLYTQSSHQLFHFGGTSDKSYRI